MFETEQEAEELRKILDELMSSEVMIQYQDIVDK